MKKIIPIIMALTVLPTFATTMCAVDDSVTVVLDPSLNVSKSDYNNSGWGAQTSKWRVYGIGTCLNRDAAAKYVSVPRLTDTNNGETHLVNGSEKYGRYCWCRLTHPVKSLWVFLKDFGSASSCVSGCTGLCPYSFTYTYDVRANMFGSIAQ